MEIETPTDLIKHEINKLYAIEKQLVAAIPVLIETADRKELKEALTKHLGQTKEQVIRLEEASDMVPMEIDEIIEPVLDQLLKNGSELIEKVNMPLRDNVIMTGTAKVEHYEMSFYKSTIGLAKQLNLDEVVDRLQKNLSEEEEAAKTIETIASGGTLIDKVADVLI